MRSNHLDNLVSSVCFLALLAGCVTVDEDSDGLGGSGGEGGSGGQAQTFQKLTVNWSLEKFGGVKDMCTAPYDKVKVSAQAVDHLEAPYSELGDPFEKVFDCAAGTATVDLPTSGDDPKPPCFGESCLNSGAYGITGNYFVTLFITDQSGEIERVVSPVLENIFQSRPFETVDISKAPATESFIFYPTSAIVLANWRLSAASDGTDLTCASSTVDTIELRLIQRLDDQGNEVTNGFEVTNTFPCTGQPGVDYELSLGAGMSSPVPGGYYDYVMRGLRGGTVIAERDMTMGASSMVNAVAGRKVSAVFEDINDALLVTGF